MMKTTAMKKKKKKQSSSSIGLDRSPGRVPHSLVLVSASRNFFSIHHADHFSGGGGVGWDQERTPLLATLELEPS